MPIIFLFSLLAERGLHALIYGVKALLWENLQGVNLFTWEKDTLKYVLQIAVSTYVVLSPAASRSNIAFVDDAMPGFRSDFPLERVGVGASSMCQASCEDSKIF